jgi:hypothetical protein
MSNFEDFLLEKYIEEEESIIDDIFTEAVRRPTEQVIKTSEDSLKKQIAKYSDLIKKHPNKAPIYKAQMDLAKSKQVVLQMKRKLEQTKKK